jgi:hypothetical protein
MPVTYRDEIGRAYGPADPVEEMTESAYNRILSAPQEYAWDIAASCDALDDLGQIIAIVHDGMDRDDKWLEIVTLVDRWTERYARMEEERG